VSQSKSTHFRKKRPGAITLNLESLLIRSDYGQIFGQTANPGHQGKGMLTLRIP